MLTNNLFNTLLSKPAGILTIMTLCMKLLRTENYRSMGFSLMVAVQEEMQTWDTDEQDKLESIIEKRSSLDLDLSLGLGIFLSTIGPINDFFVKSQFKQIKLNQGIDFDKKVSLKVYPIRGSYGYWSSKPLGAFESKEVIVTHMHAV